MISLFIDLASAQHVVALVEDDTILSIRQPIGRVMEYDLLPLLRDVCTPLGTNIFTMQDHTPCPLQRIAVVTGPGGFMTLRTTIASINTLAWAHKIPLAGIHGSDWCHRTSSASSCVWLHSTKRDLLFVRGFGSYTSFAPESIALSLTDIQQRVRSYQTLPFIGELLPEQLQALPTLNPVNRLPYDQILPAFIHEQVYTHTPLLPWYGRGI